MQQYNTLSPFLSILLEQLASHSPTASCSNRHCLLLLCPSRESVPDLFLWIPESDNINFPAFGWILYFLLEMQDVSIPHSWTYFQACSGGSMSCPQWRVSRMPHLHDNSNLKCFSRLSNGCICILLWVVLQPNVHTLYYVKSTMTYFMGQIMTNAQMMGHFVNSGSSTNQNHDTDLFNIFISTVRGRACCNWWNLCDCF